jgi:hypothetical protein
VARLFRQRLDRARPLWRIDVIGPLTGGDTVPYASIPTA